MALDFSMFEVYVIFVGWFAWPVSLPLGLVLLGLAIWKVKRWGVRAVMAVLAVALLFPVGVAATFMVPDWVHSYRVGRIYQQHAWRLDASRHIDAYLIPAGSIVHLDPDVDMTHRRSASMADVERIELSAPTDLFGARVKGVATDRGSYWRVQLVGKQRVDGWPCEGVMGVTDAGKVVKCQLADRKIAFGYVFPVGTWVDLTDEHSLEFVLDGAKTALMFDPETKVSTGGWADWESVRSPTRLPPSVNRMAVDFKAHEWTLEHDRMFSGATIPAGSTLEVVAAFDMHRKSQLSLREVSVIHLSAPAAIHGARLQGTALHFSDFWQGTLAAAQVVDGWPCEGSIRFTAKGRVNRCTLSHAYVVHGYRLPAGTRVRLSSPPGTERLLLPGNGYLLFDADNGNIISGETTHGTYFDGDRIPPEIRAMRVAAQRR